MAQLKELKSILFRNLRAKYRLVIQDSETFEEKLVIRLSRLNVIVYLGTLIIILIFGTTYLIAFTSLKEFIPGYSNPGLASQAFALARRVDSLEQEMARRDAFIGNIRNIIVGDLPTQTAKDTAIVKKDYSKLKDEKIPEDSLMRQEVESRGKYALAPGSRETRALSSTIASLNFYTPVKGYITSRFEPARGHFGLDIAVGEGEPVKAVLDGTVILAGWNMATGYTITLQHSSNLVSSYMHNSLLLKKQGDRVRAGEPIAIAGNTGSLSTGIHLHLELWYNGTAIDPEKYIHF